MFKMKRTESDHHAAKPNRPKFLGRKGGVIAISLAAMVASQAAYAQNKPCPDGPKLSNGREASWDIDKIRDFALYAGKPRRQMMSCLHRGWHDNYHDNRTPFYGDATTGVPEHSRAAIYNAFSKSPCVELDFQKLYDPTSYLNEGLILSHDSSAATRSRNVTVYFGKNVSPLPNDCNPNTVLNRPDGSYTADCTPPAYITYDSKGSATYTQPATNTFNMYKYEPSPASLRNGTNMNAIGGTYKPFSAGTEAAYYPMVYGRTVMVDVRDCMKGGKIGLVVADLKTFSALEQFVSQFTNFRASLPRADRELFSKHWMVKTKPWKMRTDNSTDFQKLSNHIKTLKDLGVAVIDTVAQVGAGKNSSGAQPKTGADYLLAKAYFDRSAKANLGNSGRRAVELVVPGTREWDPIRADNLKIWIAKDCKNTGAVESNLSAIVTLANTCHNTDRTGSNKSYFPQIWGWVPLEDGRAASLKYNNGTSALPNISPELYQRSGGNYPFGTASGNSAPFPFVIDRDTEEQSYDYGNEVLGARVITIDSLDYFNDHFGNNDFITRQDYFMK